MAVASGDRITMPMNVHVVGGRDRAQQVVVKRGDVDAALKQLRHHRLDLGFGQHEIAHDQRTIGHRLESEPAAKGQRRLDSHAVNGHLKVAARDTVTVDLTLHRCGLAESGIDLAPVNVSREGLTGQHQSES